MRLVCYVELYFGISGPLGGICLVEVSGQEVGAGGKYDRILQLARAPVSQYEGGEVYTVHGGRPPGGQPHRAPPEDLALLI